MVVIEHLPDFLNCFITTVEFTLFGVFAGLGIGTLLAIGDLYGGRIISTVIRIYVEFFRGSPIVIQLFIFYYAIPNMLRIIIDAYVVGFLVFSLNSAAYQKGYIKGAIEAISTDQMTAALSIGLSKVQAIGYVILPQALRLVMPAWGNEFCSLTKSTSALLVVTVMDITAFGRHLATLSFRYLEVYSFVAIIYLIWISVTMKILDIVYEKVKIPGIEISA